MPSAEENRRLIAYLNGIFAELSVPLDASIRLVWRGPHAAPTGRSVLDNQLLLLAQRFVNLRDSSDADKQQHYEQICRQFRLSPARDVFPLPVTNSFIPRIQQRLDRTPVSISYLETYDSRHGTNYADKARHALFQFANLVIKYDGTVTPAEEGALQNFKEGLYPATGAQPRNGDAPPPTAKAEAKESVPETPPVATEPPRPLEELLAELDELVGLERVKAEVRQLINFLKVQQMREEKGMKRLPVSRHMVFSGNPGTGKTTIARLLAQVFRTLKLLTRGHLIETDRAGMVAGYVGQTAIKVREVVTGALGGVLFIDEAYALAPAGGGQDFGQEAIETLLKMMEDNRHDLIVVVAGYTEKMEQFLNSNPGLRSRFNKQLHFEDYTPAQLVAIFKGFARKAEFKLTMEAERALLAIFERHVAARDETFGNARLARNLFERAISQQANRIVSLPEISEEILATIEAADLAEK